MQVRIKTMKVASEEKNIIEQIKAVIFQEVVLANINNSFDFKHCIFEKIKRISQF